jgi:small basic protein
MPSQNVIAEYLVSIGFDPDKTSFADLKKQFNALDQIVGSFQKGLNKNGDLEVFQKAIDGVAKAAEDAGAAILDVLGPVGIAVTGVAIGVGLLTAAVTAFGIKMADADLNAQKFALSLYTTTANARSLQSVMDAMGVYSISSVEKLKPNKRGAY